MKKLLFICLILFGISNVACENETVEEETDLFEAIEDPHPWY